MARWCVYGQANLRLSSGVILIAEETALAGVQQDSRPNPELPLVAETTLMQQYALRLPAGIQTTAPVA